MSEPVKTRDQVEDHKTSFVDVLITLLKHKKVLLTVPALVAVASIIVSLLLPNYYTGVTKVLPPQQTTSTSAVLAQLGSLAGLGGAGAAAGIKNPNDLYVGMLKSRTVADNLIARFDLNKLYDETYQSFTRKRLEKLTTISAGRDGIITIQVDDQDPKRAASLANAYVDELFKLTKVLAVTEASQRRLFFERQMEQAKESLARSEASTRQALQKGGLVLVEGQGRVMAETSARLRAEITVKEIQLGAMRTFASEQNPELLRTQQQIEVLRRELSRLEGTSAGGGAKAEEPNGKGIENLRLLRELRYNEVTYELLAKQYEIAKIDEAKDSAVIQVMDRAIEPDRKSKPIRSLIVIASTIFAFLLTILYALIRETTERAKLDPEQSARFARLKSHLSFRRDTKT